jgi:hypothetical protein
MRARHSPAPTSDRSTSYQEDEAVRKLVDKHGDKSWVLVASFLPNRTGKQIRERWHNQLDPNIMKGTSQAAPLRNPFDREMCSTPMSARCWSRLCLRELCEG